MSRDFVREVDVRVSGRDVMKFTLDGSWTVARLRKELFQLVFGVPPVKKQHKENLIRYTYVADMDDGTRSEEELTTEKYLKSEDDRKHCKNVLFPHHMLRFKHITYLLNSPPASSDESSSDDSYEVSLSIGYSTMIDHAKRAGDDVKGYRVFFADDDLMVVSVDGSYTVARGDDQIMTWMKKHNFILLGKDDANEECPSSSNDDKTLGVADYHCDDGTTLVYIEDFIYPPDEPWECRVFSKNYREDEKDFITPFRIELKKHTGEHLLVMNLYDQTISVLQLKDWMVEKFTTMTEDGNPPFPTCAFRLGCGSRLLRDDETVADVAQGGSQIVLKLLLVLRGGGIPVQRLEKTKAKVENSKKSLSVCASKVGEDVKTVPVVKKIGDVVQGFLVSLDTTGAQQTLLKYMTDLAKTSPQKATEIVKYLEQSTAGSPEVKMRHIAGKFFNCEGINEKIEELKMADESLKFALLLGFQRMICENKSKKEYTISSFGEALDTVLKTSDDAML
eukprot:s1252_g16.t1